MKVIKFNYPMEKRLIKKIDMLIERCTNKRTKQDAVWLIDGQEGEGKTTMSVAIAYYVAEKIGREFNEDHVFFDLKKLIKFAQTTEKQIIIWDEPALDALSSDSQKRIVKNLIRFLMTARKKRHFILLNVARFYRFNTYAAVDRPKGMVHVYSRKDVHPGRFVYIRNKYLEPLYRDCKYKKKRNYKKYASKRCRGTFPNVLHPNYKNNVLSDFDIDKYERKKDRAIASIGRKPGEENKWKKKLKEFKGKLSQAHKKEGIRQDKLAEAIGYSPKTLQRWQKIPNKA